ncbi:MAG TPA: DUF488 domain-containing protein [Alphaproteobacteria bacterium]|nr:DUF488 domain-containing protein [Alphaproteobacteria bacterium]
MPQSQAELPLIAMPHRGESTTPDRQPIVTIGHSTRPLDEFLGLLRAHAVQRLVDVRAFPRSRRHPQFNIDTLPAALEAAGIAYTHLPALGGRRTARSDSANTAWRDPGFRGYADYMETAAFEGGLAQLLDAGGGQLVAIMCAEAQPWRCHRSLIADALVARGVPVEHIMGAGKRRPHAPPPFARIAGGRVRYPAVLTS